MKTSPKSSPHKCYMLGCEVVRRYTLMVDAATPQEALAKAKALCATSPLDPIVSVEDDEPRWELHDVFSAKELGQ